MYTCIKEEDTLFTKYRPTRGMNIHIYNYLKHNICLTGADPGFQVKGGALKKIAPSGGRRENFWGISCEKSRFYAKKIIFFPILGEGGGWAPGALPPESAPV
jgi:hypothetical protein